jgi:hypothetical protein
LLDLGAICLQVEMEVRVGGVGVALKVSPVLATLLLRFKGEEQVTAAELAQQVRIKER